MNEVLAKMKHKDSTGHSEVLGRVLRDWRVKAPLPPRFQEEVWQRIERAERTAAVSPWRTLVTWFVQFMAYPAPAMTYVTVLLVVGLTAGYWHAQRTTTQLDRTFAQRYLQTVDPFQPSTRN
jgi:hypothetical protein